MTIQEKILNCPSCGYENGEDDPTCGLCGVLLPKEGSEEEAAAKEEQKAPAGPPSKLLEKHRLKREHQERIRKKRRENDLYGYAVTGLLTFLLFSVFFNLPSSLYPLNLVLNLFFSALLGMPIGYNIGRLRGGFIKGILIAWPFFVALQILVLCIPPLLGGSLSTSTLMIAIAKGILFGHLPGAIIGLHVRFNEE